MSQGLAVRENTDKPVVSLHYLQYLCDLKKKRKVQKDLMQSGMGAAGICIVNELFWSPSESEFLF